MGAPGKRAPKHQGVCFGCGHEDRWMPRFSRHLDSCNAGLDLEFLFDYFCVDTSSSECWIADWTADDTKLHDSPPKISVGGGLRSTVVHIQIAYLTYGYTRPTGLYICHRCDNHKCVRPDHFYYGTPSDNNLDAWRNNKRIVTEEWKVAIRDGQKRMPREKVLEIALNASEANRLKRSGDKHWTKTASKEQLDSWKNAMKEGRLIKNTGGDAK